MNNVIELRSQEQRHDEAANWIAKLDKGLAAKEVRALQRWMKADPANEEVLLRMAKMWDKLDSLTCLANMFPYHPSRRSKNSKALLAIAAGVLAAVGLGYWSAVSQQQIFAPKQSPVAAAASQGIYKTSVGEHSTVELSDGTRIALNTNSRVQVNYTEHRRLILLERGELHIEVAHNPTRPLSVVVGNHVVQAIGTAFDIKINSDQRVELMVTDGKVRVGVHSNSDLKSADELLLPPLLTDESVAVTKGERMLLGAADDVIETLAPEEIAVQLSWRSGNLIFRGESLGDAVAEISRYTPVEFVFLNSDLQKIRVAGLFKTGDIAGFLATLNANFNITFEQIDDVKILLKPKARENAEHSS